MLASGFPVRNLPPTELRNSYPRTSGRKSGPKLANRNLFWRKKTRLSYLFFSSTKDKPNSIFQFFGWSKCQLVWKCLPLPRVLSWWPVFGSSEHPIATSHKTTSKAGVPFWNGVGYQGGHRNPKGPCTPPMPRLPPLKYQGLISAGLIQGQEGFSIICYLATVGCRLLVVGCWLLIAGCSCCWWWWFCWLFFVVAKWQVVAVARPRATFWGIFWYIQTFNATNTPGRRLKGHIWHPLAYVVRRKTKHHVVKFQISQP